MKTILPDGRKVKFRFFHEKFDEPTKLQVSYSGLTYNFVVSGRTKCVMHIYKGNTLDVSVDGFALCSVKDKFSKPLGRKLSLERAIKKLKKSNHLTKADVASIWFSYLHRGSDPNTIKL